MRKALDYCQSRRIATVKLDATPVGRPLYESLGFVPEDEIQRWQGSSGPVKTQSGPRPWDVPSTQYELDDRAFYTPRRELLDSLIEDSCVEPAFHADASKGSLLGYALARLGARSSFIGPVVASNRVWPSLRSILS